MSGRVLSERYELVERLGAGGMAEVHRARDRLLHRDVAVKVLAPHLADDDDLVRRFEREARSAASLNHPNVVAVHDTGADGDVHFIVMELIEGPTLETVIAERGPLPVDEAVDVARQVCAGLEAAHAAGLIHRDIKPGNIMFDASGAVKVTDFGIALVTAESRLTRTSSIYGSAPYLSPEQARGGEVDERADIYGLGCVVYATLTGEGPFTAPEPVAVVYQHLHGDLEPPSARREGIPDALDAVVVRMLARDPSDRYGSAREVRRELERVARGGTPEAAAAGLAATRRLDDEGETLAMSPAGGGDDPVAAGDVDGGTSGAATDDVSDDVSDGRRPVWRTGLVVVAGLALLAAMLAATVLRPDPGSDPGTVAATPTSGSPTSDPTPSPPPPVSLEQAVVTLYETVVVGQQRDELSDKAAEELRKLAEEALDKYREGELGEALEKLDEGRRKVEELTREGEIEPERSRAVLAALDRVEEALRREAPPPDEDAGNGGGEDEKNDEQEKEKNDEKEKEKKDEDQDED